MQPSKYLLKCPIISNEQVGQKIHLIRVASSEIANIARSGQFVNIRVTDKFSPLWRRPFSIHRINRQQSWFDILFAVLGQGTEILADMKSGDIIDVLGPLGSHFNIPYGINEAILVAGGLGIAPLLLLAQELNVWGISSLLFYGTKTSDTICCLKDLNELRVNCILTTEDGSKGWKGIITDQLEKYLSSSKRTTGCHVFACGPMPMLKNVQTLLQRHGIPGQISIETLMACGLGVCMGCVVETTESQADSLNYLLVCKDGPVFDINRIKLNGRSFH